MFIKDLFIIITIAIGCNLYAMDNNPDLFDEKLSSNAHQKLLQVVISHSFKATFITDECSRIDTNLQRSDLTEIERLNLELRKVKLQKRYCFNYTGGGLGEIVNASELKNLNEQQKQIESALKKARLAPGSAK